MAAEKIAFRDTRFYPVIFMIIITLIFVGILATFYHLTRESVIEYREIALKRMILSVFELPKTAVDKSYSKFITEKSLEKITYYEARKDNRVLGYCFPISGSGLWGTIDGLIAVSPDFSRIINIEIVSQNETPGLGGRITEDWFKKQFKDKVLILDNEVKEYTLIPENEQKAKLEINQITGATQSSKAVVDMIYKNMKIISKKFRK